MALSVAIMAVPQRVDVYLANMLRALPRGVQIVLDDQETGVLPTAYRAWTSYNRGASHHLVLHDDLELPHNFMGLVTHVMKRNPDNILSFHAYSVNVYKAFEKGDRWAVCKQISGQATLFPVPLLKRLSEFSTQIASHAPMRPHKGRALTDSSVMGMFLRIERLKAYMPVPNFVQHAAPRDAAAGPNNAAKISPCFIGDYPNEEFDWAFDPQGHYETIYPYMRKEYWGWEHHLGPSPM